MQTLKKDQIRRGAPQAFPRKLFDLINSEPDAIIGWGEHGESFLLNNPKKFVDEILPKHFRHSHFSSFQRQLNLYGFKRITSGPEAGAYIHPKFKLNQPELLTDIRRTPQWSAAKERRKQFPLSEHVSSTINSPCVTLPSITSPCPRNSKSAEDKVSKSRSHFSDYGLQNRKRKLWSSLDPKPDMFPIMSNCATYKNPALASGTSSGTVARTPSYQNFDSIQRKKLLKKEEYHQEQISLPHAAIGKEETNISKILYKEETDEDWWSECLPENADVDAQRISETLSDDWDSKKAPKDFSVLPDDEPQYPPLLGRDASTSWAATMIKSEPDPQPLVLKNQPEISSTLSEPLTPSLDELVLIHSLCESLSSFDIRNFRRATLTRAVSTSSDLGLSNLSRSSSLSEFCSRQARRAESGGCG